MPSPVVGGGPGELARFRRLVNATALATLLLIVIGGVVRVSDSGLGCGPAGSGTEGWPLCNGDVVPLLGSVTSSTLIEFSHRFVAAIVGILMVAVAWYAWRRLRGHRRLLVGSIFGVVLVVAQAGLGGLTVENNLDEVLVAAHLGLAMIFLGTLIALWHGAGDSRQRPERRSAEALPDSSRPLRALAIGASALILATIVAGGYVAGTEGHGTVNQPVLGAHMACGQQFPTCVGEFMPFGVSSLIDAHLVHRLFMYLAAIAVIAMVALALRRGARQWPYFALLGLLGAQILLGAINVWAGKHAGLIVGHLTLGTLLWSTAAYATLMLLPSRQRRPQPSPRPSDLDPAAA